MEEIEKVRSKIRMYRLEKGYSQDYVGDQIGIGQVAYHKLENGKIKLKVSTLFKIAEVLEVAPEKLIC